MLGLFATRDSFASIMTLDFSRIDMPALPTQSNLMTQPALSGDEPSRNFFHGRATPRSKAEADLTLDEKFELLSTYIDGESSEQEQQLVEHWLSTDPQMQKQYQLQLKLSSAIKVLYTD